MRDLLIVRFGAIGDLLLCAPAFNALASKGLKITVLHTNLTPTKFSSDSQIEIRKDLKVFFHHDVRIITIKNANILFIRYVIASLSRKFKIKRKLYLPHYAEGISKVSLKSFLFNTSFNIKGTKKGIHKSLSVWLYISEYLQLKEKLELSDLISFYNHPTKFNNVLDDKKNIIISVSAVKEHKQWGYDKFRELISFLDGSDLSLSLSIIGIEEDTKFLNEINKSFPRVQINVAPNFNILSEMLSCTNLVICNEGGFGHIAARFTSDIIILANSIEPHGIVTPMATGATELRRRVECENCGCFENCPVQLGARCIDVEVSKVTDQILLKLRSKELGK